MKPPFSTPTVQINFHHLDPSPALAEHIRSGFAKLEDCFDRITRCHVTIEKLGHGHLHGGQFEVCVELHVPGVPLVIRHRSPAGDDAFLAVHATFQVVRRRLDDYVRCLRGEIKRHLSED